MTAIGIRNNNPLNIRPGSPWEGLATPPEVGGFCNFASPVWGFRAVFMNYIRKADRGINTVRALITEWAPPSDGNDTAAYIAAVCKRSGFGPDDVINLKAWDTASRICYAQTIQECGEFEPSFKQSDMAAGALRAGVADAPRSPIKKLGVVVSSGAAAASASAPTIVDAINTQVTPIVAQHHMATLQAICAVAAVVFGILAAVNHLRSAK